MRVQSEPQGVVGYSSYGASASKGGEQEQGDTCGRSGVDSFLGGLGGENSYC